MSKRNQLVTMLVIVALGATVLFGCGAGPAVPSVPPTALPTIVSLTAIPTSVLPTTAPTAVPTASPMPSNTSTPTIAAGTGTTVSDALAKFQAAKVYRLTMKAEVSPIFFQGQANPTPGQDTNHLRLFDIEGAQSGADVQYTFKGFMATLLGLFAGFDEKNTELGIVKIQDSVYMKGTRPGDVQAKWYAIPAEDAKNLRISSGDIVAPLAEAKYPDGAFTKTGTESIGSQSCDVYTANRAAFDSVFPGIIKSALLNPDTLALENVDRAEYKVWVCADGNLYRVDYNFDAHAKDQADKKGSFTFSLRPSDYEGAISIQAPADAIPLGGSSGLQPTSEPTTRPGTPQTFTSLDGEWEGTSSTDSPIQFRVENNAVTYVNLNFAINTGGCSNSGAWGTSIDTGAISNDTFSFTLTNDDGVKFTFAGKFTSKNSAAGTFNIKGKTFCGDTDESMTWTAQHTSPADNIDTNTPTEEPTVEAVTPEATASSTGDASSASGVLNAFVGALNQKDTDTAAALFDDNVVYTVGPLAGIGAAQLKSLLQLQAATGATYAVSNVQDLGTVASFTLTVTGANSGTYSSCSIILQGGKIAVVTIK